MVRPSEGAPQRWKPASGEPGLLFPIVAAALGAWLLDDPITLPVVIGTVAVLAGVYVGALHGALRPTTTESTR